MILRHYTYFIFRMADKAGCQETKDSVIELGVPKFVECIEAGSDVHPGGPDLISPFKWTDIQEEWNALTDDEKDQEYEDIATLIDGCWRDLEFAYFTNHDRNAFKFILGDYYRIHQINEVYVDDAQAAAANSIMTMSLMSDATDLNTQLPNTPGIVTKKSKVDYYSLNLS